MRPFGSPATELGDHIETDEASAYRGYALLTVPRKTIRGRLFRGRSNALLFSESRQDGARIAGSAREYRCARHGSAVTARSEAQAAILQEQWRFGIEPSTDFC